MPTPPNDGMWGEIWKTIDGGKHWDLLYSNGSNFYFNAIDCCNENICYAVAEGNDVGGSMNPGARIFMTNDGTNWNQMYYNPNNAATLMAVHCISPSEAYAGGGLHGSQGVMLHTTDSGQSWTNISFEAPILYMDMTNDGNYGIATGVDYKKEGAIVYAYS